MIMVRKKRLFSVTAAIAAGAIVFLLGLLGWITRGAGAPTAQAATSYDLFEKTKWHLYNGNSWEVYLDVRVTMNLTPSSYTYTQDNEQYLHTNSSCSITMQITNNGSKSGKGDDDSIYGITQAIVYKRDIQGNWANYTEINMYVERGKARFYLGDNWDNDEKDQSVNYRQSYSKSVTLQENGLYKIHVHGGTYRRKDYISYNDTLPCEKGILKETTRLDTNLSVASGTATREDVSLRYAHTGTSQTLGNAGDWYTFKYAYSVSGYPSDYAARNGTAVGDGTVFSPAGYYKIAVWCKAFGTVYRTFHIDKTAPSVSAPAAFTNSSFVFSASDTNGATVWYRKDNGDWQNSGSSSKSVAGTEENAGVWQFKAIDGVGNETGVYTTRLFLRQTFGNRERIRNSYFAAAWWEVTLPAKIFGSSADTYSFSAFDTAMAYAEKCEWDARVEKTAGGWRYVNKGNETNWQLYTDYAELQDAVHGYAKRYVSERKTLAKNGSVLLNPTDENFVTRPDALTAQNVALPGHLSEFATLPLYLIPHDFAFTRPTAGVSDNATAVSIQCVSDGVGKVNRPAVGVPYGEPIQTVLENAYEWRNGYYLVTESDSCGNIEQYLVCIDTGYAVPHGTATLGSGESMQVSFSYEYTKQNEGLLRYAALSFGSVTDGIDEWTVMAIEGRGLTATYVPGDELPVLSYEEGYYGAYTVTVYDRSLNVFSFAVYIAGEPPQVTHSSLKSDVKCTLTVSLNDANNAIERIRLYKVMYDGTYVEKTEDDDGTLVSPRSLEYVLRIGGKYVLEITDLYGRTLITDPLFYLKGMPSGELKGVKEGGVTNRDVSLSYTSEYTAWLYVLSGDAWERADEDMRVVSEDGKVTASVQAQASVNKKYKFFLYYTDDMNLFVEYTFRMKTSLPSVQIYTKEGNELFHDATTRQSFRLTWDDTDIKVRYYKRNSALGEANATDYKRGMLVTASAAWRFIISDSLGNSITVDITLDNAVDYSIEGNYKMFDGAFVSKTWLSLSVNEKTRVFTVDGHKGIQNGQRLTEDGTYAFYVEDMLGNTLYITLIIDKLPPEIVVLDTRGNTLPNGARTDDGFTITCTEASVKITFTRNNGDVQTYVAGRLLADLGMYSITATDRMGNSCSFTVHVDRSVAFAIEGSYVQIDEFTFMAKNWLILQAKESLRRAETESDAQITVLLGQKVTTEGTHRVTLEDEAGNVVIVTLIIDRTPPRAQIIAENGDEIAYNGITGGTFTVTCEEVSATLEYNAGGAFAPYLGQIVGNEGMYTFRLRDLVGNVQEFTVQVDRSVAFTLDGTYVETNENEYSAVRSLAVIARETFTIFEVVSDNGVSFGAGDTVTAEGRYTVRMVDGVGNEIVITLIIDRTPPALSVTGVENGGTTGGNVTVIAEGNARLYDNRGGMLGELDGETVISEHGTYTVRTSDVLGNTATLTFTIDKRVDVAIAGLSFSGQIVAGVVSFSFNEAVTVAANRDGQEFPFKYGDLKTPGAYEITATDAYGNVQSWAFTLIAGAAQVYELDIPDTWEVYVSKSGGAVTNAVQNGKLTLGTSGDYVISFACEGYAWDVAVTVANEKPTVELVWQGHKVTAQNPSAKNLTYRLTKNGKEKAFSIGDTISANGSYVLTVTDTYGNSTEYAFTVQYINGAGIFAIVLLVIAVLAVAVFLLVWRMRTKVR